MSIRTRMTQALFGYEPAPSPSPEVVRRDVADISPGYEGPVQEPEGVTQAMLRRLDSIVNTMTGLGSLKDKGAVARPDLTRRKLTFVELTCLYLFNGYTPRIVDLIVDEGTRKAWRVVDDADHLDVMAKEDKRLSVVSNCNQAWKWGRLYGGATILMVVHERPPLGFVGSASELLMRPLDLSRVIRVKNLIVFDRQEATPIEFEGDASATNRYREPKLWQLNPTTQHIDDVSSGTIVHHSRMLYFPGKVLPPRLKLNNHGYDESVLQSMYDAIRNKTSIDQAMATLIQEAQIPQMTIEGLANLVSEDKAKAFMIRMRLLALGKSINRMIVLGKGESYTVTPASFAGLKDMDTAAKDTLSAVSAIPQTRLYGQAPGGLGTDGASAIDSMTKDTSAAQTTILVPPLTKLYSVLFASTKGPTAGVTPKEWSLMFNPLDEPTEAQVAALKKTTAETDALNITSGVYSAEHVARSRYAGEFSTELLPVFGANDENGIDISDEKLAEIAAIVNRGGEPLATAPPDQEAANRAEPEDTEQESA